MLQIRLTSNGCILTYHILTVSNNHMKIMNKQHFIRLSYTEHQKIVKIEFWHVWCIYVFRNSEI